MVSTARAYLSAGDGLLGLTVRDLESGMVTLSKLECSKQAYALNTLAWNNTIGLWPILLVCRTGVMIKRDSRGHSYFIVRGEILGFMKDELLRKHLPRMFSLIKNESWGLEDD
jgi:hypothetical protein